MKMSKQNIVLTKAVINLSNKYSLNCNDISEILGLSESEVFLLNQGKRFIYPNTKEEELAILLIRLFTNLNALLGGNQNKARKWLNNNNEYFLESPLTHIKSLSGLVNVVNYLDAMCNR